MEKKVQNHMDLEDKRVGDVAEGILYEFLPAAFDAIVPPCEDPRTELTHDRCKLVASAALSIGALMNAPPPFLEFLLRIPWQKIDKLQQNSGNQEWIQEQLEIPDALRKELVNTPIHPSLIPTLLEFIFSESYQDSLPPNLRPPTEPIQQSHFEHVGALLDGAGPLHCAAIRGNPAQVDHLLYCGADPTSKTAPGDLPLQLVPYCGERQQETNQRMCHCMNERDQEVWECRSSSARALIARRTAFSFGHGFVTWLTLVFLCILNSMGLWGLHRDIVRRRCILQHVEKQMEAKSTRAYLEANRLLNEMRKEARQGQQYLAAAREMQWNAEKQVHQGVRRSDENFIEKAFLSFVHAVHFLQNLLLHNDGKEFNADLQTTQPSLPKVTAPDCQVAQDERADLYCCWAQSVLLKFESCRCPGCAAVAVQAIRMAHIRSAELLAQLEKQATPKSAEMYESVGRDLKHIVYCHICLLLETDARQSATKASMWRADQCIKEWKRLEEKNFTFEPCDRNHVLRLESWVCTAESDLMLAEALYGDLLAPSQTVSEILKLTVNRSVRRMPYILRSTSLENIDSLELALKKAKSPSLELALLTKEVLRNGKLEIQAAAKLNECMTVKTPPVVTEMTEKLSEAIRDAERFPRLAMEVKSARELLQHLMNRAAAIEQLEIIMLRAKQPIEVSGHSVGNNVEPSIIQERMTALQNGIEQGKNARINTEKARKLLRELQAQMMIIEAGHQLDVVMARRPCGSAALKAALSKAESCCSSATVPHGGLISLSEYLLPRMQAARKRQEIERVVESLNKAKAAYRTVNDLSKLESTILDARKVFDEVGAEECDQEVYSAARTLRGTLHDAAKVQQQLQNCTKMLQKHQRKVDAVALEEAIQSASHCWHLVEEDATTAQQALDHWNCMQRMEEHLSVVIRDAHESSQVLKAVQEAAAVGVRTQSAKRILKLMQNVEHGVEQLRDRTITSSQLRVVIDEAESGGVSQAMVSKTRSLLRNAQASQAKEMLSEALAAPEINWEERRMHLHGSLEQALSLMEWSRSLTKTDSSDMRGTIEAYLTEEGLERSREICLLLEYVDKVMLEVQRCKEEQLKLEEEEKARRAKDLELERQRKEKEKEKSRQKEIERQQKEREAAVAREEERLKEDQRQKMELRLQRSLEEKQEKEKRSSIFRRPFVDPATNEAFTPALSPVRSTESSGDDSYAVMEYEVQRLLEDASPSSSQRSFGASCSYCVSDVNLRTKTVRGVLESLEDPWGIQSEDTLPATSDVPASLDLCHYDRCSCVTRSDPLEALLAQKRMMEGMRSQEMREGRFSMQQSIPRLSHTHDVAPSWNQPVSGLVGRRSAPLDSAAPAFYPSVSRDQVDYKKPVNSLFSALTLSSPLPSPTWGSVRRLDIPKFSSAELPRITASPFPGVGAGIPGTPSRSLSENMARLMQRSVGRSEKDVFSRSKEF